MNVCWLPRVISTWLYLSDMLLGHRDQEQLRGHNQRRGMRRRKHGDWHAMRYPYGWYMCERSRLLPMNNVKDIMKLCLPRDAKINKVSPTDAAAGFSLNKLSRITVEPLLHCAVCCRCFAFCRGFVPLNLSAFSLLCAWSARCRRQYYGFRKRQRIFRGFWPRPCCKIARLSQMVTKKPAPKLNTWILHFELSVSQTHQV